MPITITVEENGWLLHYKITDPVDVSDLLTAYNEEQTLRDAVPHTVHSITDMSGLHRIPKNWLRAKSGPGLTHPRSGEMVIVGMSSGVTIIIQALLRIARFDRVKLMITLGDAYAYLRPRIADAQVSTQDGQEVHLAKI